MDPVGSEPARDRSAAESRVPRSDSVDTKRRQIERISDVTPPELNAEGRSDSAVLKFCAMVGNLVRYIWHQATDSSSRNWPPKWLKTLGILWILWLGILIIWLVIVIIIPAFIKILVALGLGSISLISKTQWAQVVFGPVHSYLDTHSAGLPFSPGQLFSLWVLLGIALFFSSFKGSVSGRIGWAVFGIETSAVVWSETPELSKWLTTGLTVLFWLLLSTLAYRKKKGTPSHFVDPFMDHVGQFAESLATPKSLDTIENRAEQNARRRKYANLADYLDNNANRPRRISCIRRP
jgi:hypothetical protein